MFSLGLYSTCLMWLLWPVMRTFGLITKTKMIFFQFSNFSIISSSNNERYIYFKVTTEVLNEISYSNVDYYMNWKLFLNETIWNMWDLFGNVLKMYNHLFVRTIPTILKELAFLIKSKLKWTFCRDSPPGTTCGYVPCSKMQY